uniref:SRCR domain-containing protein n=1 Tax=Amazona collaria TaxID=241587 RepID=A0A8B9GFK4_9PSIT
VTKSVLFWSKLIFAVGVQSPGVLRLAGGRSRCEGRVEMEEEGAWGTVCDDGWDLADADVVCRQLRCGHAVSVHGGAAYGRGNGSILRDEMGCEGHEEHLWECPAALEHDCTHKEDAGVVCSGGLVRARDITSWNGWVRRDLKAHPSSNTLLRTGTPSTRADPIQPNPFHDPCPPHPRTEAPWGCIRLMEDPRGPFCTCPSSSSAWCWQRCSCSLWWPSPLPC